MNEIPAKRDASELVLRVVSAIILAAIALGALFLGGEVFASLCAAGSALIAWEYRTIIAARLSRELALAMLALVALVFALWFAAGPDHAFAALAGGFVLLFFWEMIASRSFWAASGLAYCGLPFLALCLLRGVDSAGAIVVLFIFAIVWGADILAYFAGRTIGGPKLAPRISPKKTWAGFHGGIAGSLILAGAVALALDIRVGVAAAVLGVALSIVSQVGDLYESWIKRHFAIKDSSTLIPGHGGVMDRLDGLVFVAVAVWLFGIALGGQALVIGSATQAMSNRFLGG